MKGGYMHAPCANCPFLKKGGIPLRPARIREIAANMLSLSGGEFHCHKTTTTDDDGERISTAKSQHCGGALVFAEKHATATQMMRIAKRLGMYDPQQLKGHELVWDSLTQWLSAARRSPRTKKAQKGTTT